MSEIKGLISEVSQIDAEIKRLNTQKRKLHARKKECEARIVKFLDRTNQAGVKYQGTALIAKTRNRRGRRKKKDQEKDGSAVLKKYGINNSDKIVRELLEAIKGQPKEDTVLQMKKY